MRATLRRILFTFMALVIAASAVPVQTYAETNDAEEYVLQPEPQDGDISLTAPAEEPDETPGEAPASEEEEAGIPDSDVPGDTDAPEEGIGDTAIRDADPAAGEETPSDGGQPAVDAPSAAGGQPVDGGQPVEEEQPAAGGQPADEEQPAAGEPSGDEGSPAGEELPADAEQPADEEPVEEEELKDEDILPEDAGLAAEVVSSGYCGAQGSNMTWTLDGEGTLTISGSGAMANYTENYGSNQVAPPWDRSSVKKLVIEEGVTSIGDCAFYRSYSLEEVHIPTTLTYSGRNAFVDNKAMSKLYIKDLESWFRVTFPDSFSTPMSGGRYGDVDIQLYIDGEPVSELVIPEGTTSISDYAFFGLKCVTSVSFPSSLRSIGNGAFYDCSGLEKIVLPEGVATIGNEAFRSCGALADMTIPHTVTHIGGDAFYGDNTLTALRLDDLASWLSIEFGNKYAHPGWANQISVYVNGEQLRDLVVPEGVTAIPDNAFQNWGGIESVTIPEGVTYIGSEAFIDMQVITDLRLPSSLQELGDNAFRGSQVTNLYIENVESWLDMDFGSGAAPNGVKGRLNVYVGGEFCRNLVIPDGVTEIPERAFAYWGSVETVTFPEGLTGIGKSAFANTGVTEVYLPEGLASIGGGAFSSCRDLAVVTFPDSLTDLGNNAFSGCVSLTEVTIPGGIGTLQNSTFSDCTGLKRVTLGEGITRTGTGYACYCFLRCTALEEVYLPLSLTSLEAYSFYECPALRDVYYAGTEADWGRVSKNSNTNKPLVNANIHFAIPIAPPAFPDPAFSAFVSENFDKDGNGLLSGAEAAAVTEIHCSGHGITDLTGIEYFPNLKVLDCSDNDLTELDLSGNPALTKLDVTGNDGLKEVDISGNPGLQAEGAVQAGPHTAITGSPLEAEGVLIRLDREYLAMRPGDPDETVTAEVTPAEFAPLLTWSAENAPEKGASPDDEAVIEVSEDGEVTALMPGTGYAVAAIEYHGRTYSARCRVDVVDEMDVPLTEQVTGVLLAQKQAAVELYRTDYTRLYVVPLLSQNIGAASVNATVIDQYPDMIGMGAAVTDAELVCAADPAISTYFKLRVTDDRALEIVPTNEAMRLGMSGSRLIRKSYKAIVRLTIDDEEFDTAPFTLTVKKTLPKITVKTLKFNSWQSGGELPLTFTGPAAIEKIIPDPAAAAPAWLSLDTDERTVTYIGAAGAKQSCSFGLLVWPEGWALSMPVTVKVNAAAAKPKITFKPAVLTVKPGTDDCASTTFTVKPADSADHAVTVARITEEGADAPAALRTDIDGNTLTVHPVSIPDTTAAHTYKVYLAVDGAEYPVTVKTLPDSKAVTLSVKASGAIDTAIEKSPITLKITPKNYHAGSGENYEVRFTRVDNGTKEERDLPDTALSAEIDGTVITVRERTPGSLRSGYTYYAYTKAVFTSWTETPETQTKLNVKFTDPAKVPAPVVTMKAAGRIDVLRPAATSVTLTPTVKNCYSYELDPSMLSFYTGSGKSIQSAPDAPFDVRVSEDGKSYVLTLKEGAAVNHVTAKYSAKLTVLGTESKAYTKIPLTQSREKLRQSTKAVTLYKKDRFSSAPVRITTTNADVAIERIELDPKSAAAYDIEQPGYGSVVIRFRDSAVPVNVKAGKVKLRVFLEGNISGKPNAVITVNVKLK